MEIKLKYLRSDVDARGNVRNYARTKGRSIRLREPPGTPKFLEEYQAALEVLKGKQKTPGKTDQIGTLGWLAEQWHRSPQFTNTDKRQQRMRILVMRHTLEEPTKPGSPHKFADCPIASFTADHVRLLRNRKKDTPSAANRRVAELRKMFEWGVEDCAERVKRNVVKDVAGLKYDKEGFTAWSEEEIDQFEAFWPIGSIPRLALSIGLYLGVRRSDAVLLGPLLVKDGDVTFVPQKTRRKKKVLTLPILPILQNVIDKTSATGTNTWLVTQYGKPFTAPGFGNWFRDKCNAAGLPERTFHGLRSAGAERVAENGGTEKEMMDIYGWTKADLASYYARKANQKKIAANAMHKLIKKGS